MDTKSDATRSDQMDYLSLPYARGEQPAAAREATAKLGGIADILSLLRTQVGFDFRCYKKSTIARRIERRMGLHRIADLASSLGFLQEHDDEASHKAATVPGIIPVAVGGNETFVRQLEDELRITQQDLQANIEELQASNEELTRFNHAMVDRELRMIELKKEVNALCGQTGEAARYTSDLTQNE